MQLYNKKVVVTWGVDTQGAHSHSSRPESGSWVLRKGEASPIPTSYRESGERCKLSQQDPEPSSGENGFLCIVCVEMVTVGNSSHFVGLKNFRLHFKK